MEYHWINSSKYDGVNLCYLAMIFNKADENDLADYIRMKRRIQEIIDMPDRLIDLFIRLTMQNNGHLSTGKRKAHFDFLTDDELYSMEQAVKG